MIDVKDERDVYLASFERFEREQAGENPRWLRELRKLAMERFTSLGFPTTQNEEWRFTSVTPLTKIAFQIPRREIPLRPQGGMLEHLGIRNWKGYLMVFLNGRFCRELSLLETLPSGVQLLSLAAALQTQPETLNSYLARCASFDEHPFTALNTAFIQDGAFIFIPKDTVVERPIHLLFVSTSGPDPTMSHPRNLIIAGANSQASILESYAGLNNETYFTNAVTETILEDNALIDHYRLQRESLQSFHFSSLQVHQHRSSNFSTCSITLGGALVRNDVTTVLMGEGAEAYLNGLYVVSGHQHVDNHTQIDHAKPHCSSRELYKGILDQKARGVFNGRIIVRPDAQKTDSKQTNKNLLLSEEALANTNPQLEIYADDVKCTHGATIGQLSADALFYLRARGLGLETARNLLIHAFASEIMRGIKIEPLRQEMEVVLHSRLPRDGKVGL